LEAFEQAGEGIGFGRRQVSKESCEPVAELGLS
jgi:hypothetical protein